VPTRTLALAAGLFAVVGAILRLARRPLFAITEAPEEARDRGLKVWFWDFLFYTAFGVVAAFILLLALTGVYARLRGRAVRPY
jgi:ABC-type Mn2+/Zn2+ transport system permease subunit